MKQMIIPANTKGNNTVLLSLGSNLKNREENIKIAIEEIKDFAKIIKQSSIYETAPVGYKNQGLFLNCALKIETTISPTELIIKLKEIEHKTGRPLGLEAKNRPRIIDIDILFYGDKIINEKNLKIPHPRLHKRNFVLTPLRELAPNKIHPILKKNIKTLLTELKNPEKIKLWI